MLHLYSADTIPMVSFRSHFVLVTALPGSTINVVRVPFSEVLCSEVILNAYGASGLRREVVLAQDPKFTRRQKLNSEKKRTSSF